MFPIDRSIENLGGLIEKKERSWFFIVMILSAALVTNVVQFVVGYAQHSAGLSGVVYAVLGFVWWLGWLRPQWGLGLPRSIVGFMLIWLVIGYTDLLWVEMANTAHLAGLICGCALAALLAIGARRKPV